MLHISFKDRSLLSNKQKFSNNLKSFLYWSTINDQYDNFLTSMKNESPQNISSWNYIWRQNCLKTISFQKNSFNLFLFVDSSDQNVWKHPAWMRKLIQNLPPTRLLRYITLIQTNVSLKSSHEGTHISFFIFLCFVRSHMFDVSWWEGWNLPFWVWAKRVGFGWEKSMDKPTLLSNLRLRHQVSV